MKALTKSKSFSARTKSKTAIPARMARRTSFYELVRSYNPFHKDALSHGFILFLLLQDGSDDDSSSSASAKKKKDKKQKKEKKSKKDKSKKPKKKGKGKPRKGKPGLNKTETQEDLDKEQSRKVQQEGKKAGFTHNELSKSQAINPKP